MSPDLALPETRDPRSFGARAGARLRRSSTADVAQALETVTGKHLVQMAKSGELKIATRRDNASCVSAARTIVRPPTAGR